MDTSERVGSVLGGGVGVFTEVVKMFSTVSTVIPPLKAAGVATKIVSAFICGSTIGADAGKYAGKAFYEVYFCSRCNVKFKK